MPTINLTVPHGHSRADAAEKLKSFAEVVRQRYKDQVKDVHEEWREDGMTFGFKTMGVEITGDVAVNDSSADVRAKIPFAAMMFKGRIEQEIRDAMNRALA